MGPDETGDGGGHNLADNSLHTPARSDTNCALPKQSRSFSASHADWAVFLLTHMTISERGPARRTSPAGRVMRSNVAAKCGPTGRFLSGGKADSEVICR